MVGSLAIVRKKFLGPTFNRMDSVKIIKARDSSDESSVEIFVDSQINGRYNVATIAAGAIFTILVIDPSKSTPSEKLDSPMPWAACWL